MDVQARPLGVRGPGGRHRRAVGQGPRGDVQAAHRGGAADEAVGKGVLLGGRADGGLGRGPVDPTRRRRRSGIGTGDSQALVAVPQRGLVIGVLEAERDLEGHGPFEAHRGRRAEADGQQSGDVPAVGGARRPLVAARDGHGAGHGPSVVPLGAGGMLTE